MFVDYSTLSEESKVWIYPSSRKFYPQEIEGLKEKLQIFVDQWKTDDADFKASFQFLHNRFIVFLAEENSELTNADLDAQVAFVLQLQQEYEIELLDKMNVCFKQGEYTQYKELKDFKKLIKNKAVTGKTIIFDNLIQTKFELENYWEVPITDSWYNRFL
ncbi:ABC transporter ATPase [Tenacibaculum sp. S7007]|uniref:ABC transporter ATPase n=1 Tax=Tenacibaculum pelagium TaxID=2759527 RepID=A0A839AUB4_9FLAO|nr:ABC transporter ATPase [Tenacibaculum pelagium]MBA6157191.1 ABC transporter ATPase [Tenacibaculum pelagium]